MRYATTEDLPGIDLPFMLHEKIFDRYGGALVMLVLLELNGMHIEASTKSLLI